MRANRTSTTERFHRHEAVDIEDFPPDLERVPAIDFHGGFVCRLETTRGKPRAEQIMPRAAQLVNISRQTESCESLCWHRPGRDLAVVGEPWRQHETEVIAVLRKRRH